MCHQFSLNVSQKTNILLCVRANMQFDHHVLWGKQYFINLLCNPSQSCFLHPSLTHTHSMCSIISSTEGPQPLALISVGSWWYFLSETRAEGGTGWLQLPALAHPWCTPRLWTLWMCCSKGSVAERPVLASLSSHICLPEMKDSGILLTSC